jgi:hypothetical protein
MDGSAHGALRDANGRFVAGHSGNPAGKQPGTRNRASVLREALGDGEDIAAARIVIDKALSGDMVAARFIIGRLEPRPRSRAVELDLPEGTSARDIVAAYDVTLRAMATGEITPDEALQVSRVLDGRLRALKMAAREETSVRAEQSPSPALAGTKDPRCRSRRGEATPRERGEGHLDVRGERRCPPRHLHSACILQITAAARLSAQPTISRDWRSGDREWPSLIRRLDREDPGYKS